MTKQQKIAQRKVIAPYEKPSTKNSIIQLLNTIIPFFILWYLAYESLSLSYLLTLALTVLGAGLLIRLFIIFHDACHTSFFNSNRANEVVGNITGVLTLFAFHQWRYSHNVHHATSGNLNKRGVGDIWVMTVEEYSEASFWQRMGYRFYRNPIVMFGLGPIYLFLISNRFNRKGARKKERMNTYFINLAVVLLYGMMCWLIGWQAFLMIQGPLLFFAGFLGVWLFYVQHHFEDSYFEKEEDWDFVKAAVEGSSFYKLPRWLQWFTGSIGYHHVHHLSSRVPNYYLEDVHNSYVPLQAAQTVTIRSSLKALKYRLWDEKSKQFVGFEAVKKEATGQRLAHKVKVTE